ncbi:uncharacterized protein [Nicotiana sylvestris]|uniref:uncharacterized protein n=1 Tax=Nicotiana sylvestris TaxID=4096 RepID=UPI00388C502D
MEDVNNSRKANSTERVEVTNGHDIELPKGYKPLKFKMFDGTGDPRVHLRTYCDKIVGVGKDEKIRIKLFMKSLKGDALSWFNTENVPDVFYIQNLKKKPTETFREYATRWRSEAANVTPTLEEEQMNKFFVRAQDPQPPKQYTAIAEPIDQLYEKLKAAGYVTYIPIITPENPSQWVNLNKSCAYHSGMKGHTIDECRSLKDKIQALIDNKIIMAKEPAPNIRNNPLSDHKGEGIHMIEIEDNWDFEGSIGLITRGDDPKKPIVTLNPIIVQIQPSGDAEVNMFVTLEFEATTKTPTPIEVEFVTPANAPLPFEVAVLPPKAHAPFGVKMSTLIPVAMSTMTPFHTKAIPWDYTAEARRKGKGRTEETIAAQGMTRTGRIYTPEHLAESSKQASNQSPIIEMGPNDLWRKMQAKEYSVIDQLNKTLAQISILVLLQNSEAHKNALLKVLSEAYVPSNITGGEMANMIVQDNKIKSILNWYGYEPGKGLGKNLQGITKPIKLKKYGTTSSLGYEYTCEEFNNWSPPWRGPYYPLEPPIPYLEQTFQPADVIYGPEEEKALAAVKNLFLEDNDMDCCVVLEEEGEEGPSIQVVSRGAHLNNWTIRTTRARRAWG